MTRILSFILFVVVVSCSSRPSKPPSKKIKKAPHSSFLSEKAIRRYLKRKIPREGKYSIVTHDDVTTERYRREKSESVFILENEELRSETEKMEDGIVLTRTINEGKVTSLTLSGSKRSTLIHLDREGKLVHKIITEKGKRDVTCFSYEGEKPVKQEGAECLELIPAF